MELSEHLAEQAAMRGQSIESYSAELIRKGGLHR